MSTRQNGLLILALGAVCFFCGCAEEDRQGVKVTEKEKFSFPIQLGVQDNEPMPVEIKNKELSVKLGLQDDSGVGLPVRLDMQDGEKLGVEIDIPKLPLIPIVISGAAAVAAVVAGLTSIITACAAAKSARAARQSADIAKEIFEKYSK